MRRDPVVALARKPSSGRAGRNMSAADNKGMGAARVAALSTDELAGAAAHHGGVALWLSGVTKIFGGQAALRDVDLEVRGGEIHALLGQNGSGKSTLIKVLSGYHRPEPGARAAVWGHPLALDGRPPGGSSPLRFVHQDRALLPDLDATDNLALVSGYRRVWWLSAHAEQHAAQRFLHEYGIEVDVTRPVGELSVAAQAMLAIARALIGCERDRVVLVLDEATASLPAEDVEKLFQLVRQIRDSGGAVIYVTHRLNEVIALADRVTVLRDGHRVATRQVCELNHDDLVELIIGRSVDAFYPEPPAPDADVVIEVKSLAGATVKDVSFEVRQGEIIGVTGLVGSGYEDLLALMFGAQPRRSGEVLLGGATVGAEPRAAMGAGLAFAPSDRARLSAMPGWSLAENVTLPKLEAGGRLLPWLSSQREQRDARVWLDRLGVVPSDPARIFSTLSGGNQQRVVIARWLRAGFKAFLLEDPTMGVDVGAKPPIYEALADAARKGAAVLLSTSDAEEAAAVCDRVVVMREGQIATILEGADRTVDQIVAAGMRSH
jgi:ribose transport system ATP-binding protein